MPTLDTLLVFVGPALLLAVLPGPGLLYVVGRTLAEGQRAGLASSLGAGIGGLVHVAAGAVGVSAVIVASATAFMVLKAAGGLYLLWLAWTTWRSAGSATLADQSAGGVNLQCGTSRGAVRALRQGIVVEATNPKTAAFFLAFIPQFLEPAQGSVPLQFAVLGLVSVIINTANASLVVMMAGALRSQVVARPSLLRRLQQGSAAILASLGLWLLMSRRSV